MKLGASIPVRFKPEVRARLKVLAERSDLNLSELVRRATEAYLERIEKEREIVVGLREVAPDYGAKKEKP